MHKENPITCTSQGHGNNFSLDVNGHSVAKKHCQKTVLFFSTLKSKTYFVQFVN